MKKVTMVISFIFLFCVICKAQDSASIIPKNVSVTGIASKFVINKDQEDLVELIYNQPQKVCIIKIAGKTHIDKITFANVDSLSIFKHKIEVYSCSHANAKYEFAKYELSKP